MNDTDKQKLQSKIQSELGIDIQSYQNPELVEQITDLFVFPTYVIKYGARVLLLSLFIFILGYFLLDLVHIEYAIYSVLGFVLFLLLGIIGSIWYVSWKLKTDIREILDYSITISKNIISDLKTMQHKIGGVNRKTASSLIFSGVLNLITLPIVDQILTNKIPLFGSILSRMMQSVFGVITSKLSQEDDVKIDSEVHDLPQADQQALELNIEDSRLNKLVNVAFSVTQFPIKTLFLVIALVTFVFIYLIN